MRQGENLEDGDPNTLQMIHSHYFDHKLIISITGKALASGFFQLFRLWTGMTAQGQEFSRYSE
jgi:hypothetical protein